MDKLNCLIADDEPLALDLIRGYVERVPFLNLIQACTNANEVVEASKTCQIDLVFLDIQMPGVSGLELARTIDTKTLIIFTTAFDNYAVEGYKVNAIGYLLKPFNFEEFYDAAAKAQAVFESRNATNITNNDQFIFVKTEYRIQRIEFNNILYIEGLKDYVKIYLQNQIKPVVSLMSMKSINERLPQTQFMRIHRSYIVNLTKIQTIERSRILFGDVYIPVSDNYKEQFWEFVKNQFLE
jgi:DNA-binding LytR/AlgR family response regulator